jgi:hypothetical protein
MTTEHVFQKMKSEATVIWLARVPDPRRRKRRNEVEAA